MGIRWRRGLYPHLKNRVLSDADRAGPTARALGAQSGDSMGPRPRINPYHLVKAAGPTPLGAVSERLEARVRLRFTVAQALAQDRLIFRFQPVASMSNLTFAAFHELIPMLRMADGQILPVSAFASAVEGNEIGLMIARLSLRRALRVLDENPGLRLSVDVAPGSMGDAEWLDLLTGYHARGSGACGRLILEVSEDAAVRDAGLINEFAGLVRGMGPALALDNFGAGATGFAHFRAFRFDMAKLDPALCRGVHANPDAQVLVECLQRLALQFEMFCVADGVETEEDVAWLCDTGIDCIQGQFFGRPAACPEPPAHERRRDGRAAG